MRFAVSRLSFLAAIGLVLVLSAELTARIQDHIYLGIGWFAVPDHDRDLILHDDLGIRGRPNGRFKKWRLNSFGFRGPEISVEPPSGCVRVMVLGASETFGLYESIGKEYPAQLDTELKRSGCFEVLNASVVGLSLRGITTLWNNWASRFRPDIVVIYPTPAFYLANSAPGSAASGSGSNVPQPAAPWYTLRIVERARDVIEVPRFIQKYRAAPRLAVDRPPGWAFTSVPDDRLVQFRKDLDQLSTAVQARGGLPVLLTHATVFGDPVGQEDEEDLRASLEFAPRASPAIWLGFERAANEEVLEVARVRGEAVVDVGAAMDGHRKWFGDAMHFNDDGAAVISRMIAQEIVSNPIVLQRIGNRIKTPPPLATGALTGRN